MQGSEHLSPQTTETIEGATSALEEAQRDRRPDQERQFALEGRDLSLSLAGNNGYKGKLGVAPWHKRKAQDTLLSVTSTIRDLLRGKTPAGTPNPEMEYDDYKGNKYSKGMHWSFMSGTWSSNL